LEHDVEGNQVMAMSYYPNEAEPLWSKYSTHSIIHTLNIYSRYTFAYPYPVAISVNGPVYGMEYPMICFNGPRPEKDGTYSKRTKYGLISVVIHEVGHNYFPMIVNSDERQWTWMDEGINTFLQYLAEQEWEDDYPSGRGEPKDIVGYMRSSSQVPIMTNSESILQFGPNAYGKPATALNILRETILGRELFDYAFKEYARRWRFRRPMPADFFRTMEDASGVDLDWFWRGWFYSTDHTDLAITNVRLYTVDTGDPEKNAKRAKDERAKQPETLSKQRNDPLRKRIEDYPELKDFYNEYDPLDVTDASRKRFQQFLKGLDAKQKKLLGDRRNFYVVDFQNLGGLVMPIILEIEYANGKKEELRIPAEIWRRNSQRVSKLFISDKEVKSLTLDPHLETADVDLENNYFPRRIIKSRFQLYKQTRGKNEMQRAGLGKKDDAKKKSDPKKDDAKKDPKKDDAKKPAEKKPAEKKPAENERAATSGAAAPATGSGK
ncbi:MAG: M1 family aminopeptidase, partial [Pirellulaceae bacterium]|nr:M1 family aminopeptidase [Pirellulaceae bacterium]